MPPAATHLYLGYVDSCTSTLPTVPGCYSDNVGLLNVTARLQYYIPDWVEPTLPTAPSARCCSAIAYDAAHYCTLLFGGGPAGQPNPNPQNDTWLYARGLVSPHPQLPDTLALTLAYAATTRRFARTAFLDDSS